MTECLQCALYALTYLIFIIILQSDPRVDTIVTILHIEMETERSSDLLGVPQLVSSGCGIQTQACALNHYAVFTSIMMAAT